MATSLFAFLLNKILSHGRPMIHLRESIKKYKENVKMKSKTLGGWDTKVERMSEKGERMHSK